MDRTLATARRKDVSGLIFPWRVPKTSFFPKLVAWVMAAATFTYLITMVRIQVIAPERVSPRTASVIYLTDDAQSRELALRAQEGGPFPSRFKLSQWDGFAALEAAALDAVHWTPPPYAPVIEELPMESRVPSLPLAVRGQPVFPRQKVTVREIPAAGSFQPAPRIYPLSGISGRSVPESLPPFTGAIDAVMLSSPWRVLVRLDRAGAVVDCISLEKGDDARAALLEDWLTQIQFPAVSGEPGNRWITLGIEFTNQPVDGTDAR